MSADVALESPAQLQLDSPPSSPSQASDTAAADERIFFGPIQSPEKKYAAPSGAPRFQTPIRRSARFSAAMVPLPLFPEEDPSGPSDTREGTPEDLAPDEPSIILASRVLSACSNPSPPPSPSSLPQQSLPDLEDAPLIDISDSPLPDESTPRPVAGPLVPQDNLTELPGGLCPSPLRSSTPILQHNDRANLSQPDLINFDTPDASRPNTVSEEAPMVSGTQTSAMPPPLASIDALLSMSPNVPKEIDSHEDLPGDNAVAAANSGHEITNTPASGVPPVNPSPPLVDIELPDEQGSVPQPPTVDLQVEEKEPETADDHAGHEEQTPPLRRSSRPRRSRSSLPQTIVNTPPPREASRAEAGEDGMSSSPRPEDQQRNPTRKRKLKAAQVSDSDMGEASAAAATAVPRRVPQAARLHRELGSLSPMSAAVLTQLLPKPEDRSGSSTPQPPLQAAALPLTPLAAPAPSTPPHQSVAFVFPKVGPSDGSGVPRPKSPLRPFSPPKLGEGARTPARRVPLSQAVAEGTYSPAKLPALFGGGGALQPQQAPAFRRVALDDPTRSPAKRIPMSEAVPVPPPSPSKDKGKAVLRSPVRASSLPPREAGRGGSAEPAPLFGRRERGASVEPVSRPPALGRRPLFKKPASSDGVMSGALEPRTTLPYPLVQQQRLPASIPEGEEPPSHPVMANGDLRTLSSPAKQGSSLRQPSAGSGSKIPRIGAKPYARPKGSMAPSKLPTPMKNKSASRAKPLRIVTVGSSSSGSSDEGLGPSNPPNPLAAPKLRRVVAASSSSSSSSTPPEAAPAQGTKRKREPEASSSKPTAPAAPPVMVMRKVVPGMFNKGKEPAVAPQGAAGLPPAMTPAIPSSPMKPMGPIRARSALGWKRPQQEPQPAPAAPDITTSKVEELPPKEPSPEPAPVAAPPAPEPEPPKQASEPLTQPETSSTPTALVETPTPGPAPEPPAALEPTTSIPQPHRRSTRSKRGSSGATTDVFGAVAPPTAPSAGGTRTQRRRGALLASETGGGGAFAGMSALALKTLTSANTARNQVVLATIETEVVRRPGARPDSPTSRVRNTLERQKEERLARAERRARRAAGSDGSVGGEAEVEVEAGAGADAIADAGGDAAEGATGDVPVGEGGDGEKTDADTGEAGAADEPDLADASFMSVERDGDGVPIRHRRAPGDEEEYETPPRPERPAKRGRFEGEEDGPGEGAGAGAEGTEEAAAKRVKWDRGLQTTVFLEDTPPRPRWNVKAVPSSKGCLTPAAKALRLDTLGNVLNAELPVGGLVKEHIVVKKFVFDDDAVPEIAVPAPPPPAPTPKSTRGRGKKAKT